MVCILIRHIGVCFAAVAFADLGLYRRWKTLLSALLTVGMLIIPGLPGWQRSIAILKLGS